MAIFGILALGGLTGKEKERKRKPLDRQQVEIRYREMPDPPTSDVFVTYVGGARFYSDRNNLRSFVGFIYFDEEDEVPRIYRNDLRMMGHIPREHLKEFLAWCPKESFPCVGYVLRGSDAENLATELKIIKPYNRMYVQKEMKNYVRWVTMTHGYEYDIEPNVYDPILKEADLEAYVREGKKKEKERNRLKV